MRSLEMATRGIYKFIDNDSTYYFYKQWDNYPSGAATFIQNALKLSWKLPRLEADEFSASFVAANKTRNGDVTLLHALNEDDLSSVSFLYEISCKDGKIYVDARDTQNGTHCFNGSLDEFSARYKDDGINS